MLSTAPGRRWRFEALHLEPLLAGFYTLPVQVQELARQNYALLKQDPNHPSLQFKLVANGSYRSVRVGLHYRALGVPVPDGVQWFWIGTHAEYDNLLR